MLSPSPRPSSSFSNSIRLYNFNTAVDIPNSTNTRLNAPLGVEVHWDILDVIVARMVEEAEAVAAAAVPPPRGMESRFSRVDVVLEAVAAAAAPRTPW